MVTSHTRAKNQGQKPSGTKVGVETDGRTDGRTRPNLLPALLTRSAVMAGFKRIGV